MTKQPVTEHSAIYRGWVRHRRYATTTHKFRYRLFMMYLDLSEIGTLFQSRWLWSATGFNLAQFRRSDHLGGPGTDLREAVSDLVEQHTGKRPAGPIRLLTHLRYFGYIFNPVSFYFCFDAAGQKLDTIVAEVANTPWREQHPYVMSCAAHTQADKIHSFEFPKAFHVSPFMPMDIDYRWQFRLRKSELFVHMENRRAGTRLFDATMLLERHEMSGPALARTLFNFPFMTLKVILAIHFEALRLWLKRTPVHTHPAQLPKTPTADPQKPSPGELPVGESNQEL